MQLPDEVISYNYQSLLAPVLEDWSAAAELRSKYFLPSTRLAQMLQQLNQVKGRVATERELREVPADVKPLTAGFIDLPQQTLDNHRRKGEASTLGRILATAARVKSQVDRVVIIGAGGSSLGAQVLFKSLCNSYHNELLGETRMGVPRIYFTGDSFDNDSLSDLLELLQTTCVDPKIREECWGVIAISKTGNTLETAATYRVFRREANEFFGSHSPRFKELFIPITGASGKFRDLCKADGHTDEDIFTIPDEVGGRYGMFSAAGLLPAAVMGLDVRALLLGAASMTRRFMDEPFERNPVLQFAAVNYLMSEELHKHVRVLAVWSKKLEALGHWYDQLVAAGLGKLGRGAIPVTTVHSRDLHSRGQQLQEGTREMIVNNLLLKSPRTPPIAIGMSPDRNQDDLNALSRKTFPDLLDAGHRSMTQAYIATARPSADLILPSLTEHTIGQLLQMLMLATVVEGRLMGINPYGQNGVEAYKRNIQTALRS